jgi:heme-degrading monooxygenase HmoA
MHARMARYAFVGDPQELARRAQDEIVPILQAEPGFKGYSLAQGKGEIISFSIWETQEQAETASQTVSKWVSESIGDQVELKESRVSEILLSTALGVDAPAGVS